jgi:TPR repeat protein
MARGDANVGEGKIHVARLFYRRAAERGWADAAVAMGSTYDPYELPRMKVIGGVQASPDLARQWYEKARALGANVDERLQRLGGR